MVLGSKLNPVKVAIDSMLGRDNLGGEVVPREELTGTENILQVKD